MTATEIKEREREAIRRHYDAVGLTALYEALLAINHPMFDDSPTMVGPKTRNAFSKMGQN
jgi:hypothetical protein